MDTSKRNRHGVANQRNHHHHHNPQHLDQSEMFKQNSLSAQKKRKIIANILFVVLSAMAICIVAACVLTSLI